MEQNQRIQEVLEPGKRKASLLLIESRGSKGHTQPARQQAAGAEGLQTISNNNSPQPFRQGVETTHFELTGVLGICWVIEEEEVINCTETKENLVIRFSLPGQAMGGVLRGWITALS